MDKDFTELLIKFDYSNSTDIEKFISLIEGKNLGMTKIGVDEYAITFKK